MNYTIQLLRKAEKELFEAWAWYEESEPGLGFRFRKDFNAKAELIKNNPLMYAEKQGLREAKMNDFPYLIVYEADRVSQKIIILSVFHTSRHPKRKLK